MDPTPTSGILATTTLALDSANEDYTGGIGIGVLNSLTSNTKVAFDTYNDFTVVSST